MKLLQLTEAPANHRAHVKVCSFCILVGSMFLGGCGSGIKTVPSLSGNWQFDASGSSLPFSGLGGQVLQGAVGTDGILDPIDVDAVLHIQSPGPCFAGQTAVPMTGSSQLLNLQLSSFSIGGQYVLLSLTEAGDTQTMRGTLGVQSGCANGAAATINAYRVTSASGTFQAQGSGSVSSLVVQQDDQADGLGYFHLSGTASFTGVPCFSTGTIQRTGSTISGTQVQITITAGDAGASTALITGVLARDASSMTVASVQITSGSCAGTLPGLTLSR